MYNAYESIPDYLEIWNQSQVETLENVVKWDFFCGKLCDFWQVKIQIRQV